MNLRSLGMTGLLLLLLTGLPATAQPTTKPATRPTAAKGFGALPAKPLPGDLLLERYFKSRTDELAAGSLSEIKTGADWTAKKSEYRRELAEMLGLWPMPERTNLKPVVTGKVEHEFFNVEKIQLQSSPGLYVTGSLYLPKNVTGKSPAILYVCGHGNITKNGISYGAKTSYQHHGEWFARNGYVCLTIDTLQLGEIQGIHHGLHHEKMWWWLSRGYTPAGVEAWNAMRALDYLETRPEVDASRFGITGRSGGGAYTWWTAALDERIKVAVPVAGITDMHNHVVDGVIEGHCDCMFMVNTYRWDFAKVAALVAPRALLLSNTDKDTIFPLDGVERLHLQLKRIYQLNNAEDKLGLLITEGPHKDTQELQVPALRWFNRFLKNDTAPLENFARPFLQPEELKVFQTLPEDQKNTKIQETFVPKAASPAVPADAQAWAMQRDQWTKALAEKSFAAWPANAAPVQPKLLFAVVRNGIEFRGYDVLSQENVPLRLYLALAEKTDKPQLVVLTVSTPEQWRKDLPQFKTDFANELADLNLPAADAKEFASTAKMLKTTKWAMAFVAVRGVGPTEWSGDEKRLTHLRRRFALLGEPLDGMRVWDTRRTVQGLKTIDRLDGAAVWLQGEKRMAGIALFASLFEKDIARLDLYQLPPTLDLTSDGPDFLNVLKTIDMPAAVALAAERSKVRIYQEAKQSKEPWIYANDVIRKLGWDAGQLQVREMPKE